MKITPKVDLRLIERLLPASPPLAGRWIAWCCDDCGHLTLLDQRVDRLPFLPWLKRHGLVRLHCQACGGHRLRVRGPVVS